MVKCRKDGLLVKRSFIAIALTLLFGISLQSQAIRLKVPPSSFETVTILYTANAKGLHAASQTDAPASALQTIIGELRTEYKNSLLVDLGNFMGATPTTVLTQGRFDFQVMELLGYDLLHISNDEFTVGVENLNSRIAQTKIPVLSGNLDIPWSAALKRTILQCGNRTVGFIGVTSPDFMNLVMGKRRKGVTLEDAKTYITNAIREMRGKADIVVALTDLPDNEIAQIRTIPGLDLIITTGGNSAKTGADWISVGFPGEKVAAVARTLVSDTAVHVLELHGYPDKNKWTVDEIVGAVYPITRRTPRENATEKYLQWTIDNHIRSNNSVIGELKNPLPNINGRIQATPLGQAVADLIRHKSRSHLAIVRAESLGTGLPKGPVTEWDLIEALPYADDDLVVVRLTGAQIEALIARSKSKSGGDGFLQFSGFGIQPADMENRIGGLPIDPERSYTVTCSDFLAQGGDGYDILKEARVVQRFPVSAQDLFREGLKKDGMLMVSGLSMDTEANYWFAQFRISSMIKGRIAEPSIALIYPTEPSLVGLQLISGTLDVRMDLSRMNYLTGFKNFVEVQYGLSWDKNWKPSEILDTVEGYSQISLNLSNLLFGGVKTLDPYVSADLQTVLLFPNPMNENIDPTLPRPGSLKLAAGLELTLFKFISLKSGVRWENQPFAPSIPAITGLEEILSFKADIFPGVLSFDSTTDVFGAFDFQKKGITVSSKNQIFFSLQTNIKIAPRFQLFYNSLVGHLSYVFDVPVILTVTF